MPEIVAIMAANSGFTRVMAGVRGVGAVGVGGGKEGAHGVRSSGDAVWAQAGGGVSSVRSRITGLGEGVLGLQTRVVGVELVLVSISGFWSASLSGEGVVRSRTVSFFFFVFFGFLIFNGDGFAILGVQMARLRECMSASSLAASRVVLVLFLSLTISSESLLSSSNSSSCRHLSVASWRDFLCVSK